MLTNYLRVDAENSKYINHCIARGGGIIIQAKLDKGEKLKPTSNPRGLENFGSWYDVIDSWPEAVLNFNVRPKISKEGDFISEIKNGFSLVYAPSRNILKIKSELCGGRSIVKNSVYIPSINVLRDGMKSCFVGDLEGFTSSEKDFGKMVDLATSQLPDYTFSPSWHPGVWARA